MSLRVWLPLIRDLNNQGLSDITVTNSGATLDSNGKLGGCYYFNGNNNYITATNYANLGDTFTVSMWFNSTAVNGDRGLCCDRTVPYAGFTAYLSNAKLIIDPCASSYGSSTRWTTSFTATANTWYHLVIIRTPTDISYYVNGVFGQSKSVAFADSYGNCFSIGAFQRSGASYGTYYYGKINDVRIYDHALSAKEIKLLSQGLVAHYKLSELVQPNLFKGTLKSFTPTAYQACQINLSENLTADTTYTVQLWDVNVSHTGKSDANLGVWLYWGGGSVSLLSWAGTSYFTNGHADYLAKTFTVTSSQASGSGAGNAWINVYNSVPSATGDKYLTIGKWKLEKGSVATPWTPNSGDIYYSAENGVYDSSGYNYHGKSITTTLSCSDDTARNILSTQFNGTDDGVLIENLPLSNIINSAVTYSFWIKPNGENGARSVYFGSYSGTSWSVEKTTGNILRLYWNGSPDETCSGATISDGAWQHICVTKYGTSDVKVYINGVQKWTSTANHANLTFPTTYRIGRDVRSGDGTPYKGLMSDFRIYATALSADDVQQLYNAPVSVSNTGCVFTQGEFIES